MAIHERQARFQVNPSSKQQAHNYESLSQGQEKALEWIRSTQRLTPVPQAHSVLHRAHAHPLAKSMPLWEVNIKITAIADHW